MLNGCLTQLSFLFGIIIFAFLALIGPAVGNVFEDVITELDVSTATFVPTAIPTATDTPTATATFTETLTPTVTASNTATPTETFTPTNTATATETPTSTPTFTSTATFTPTFTPTPAPVCSVRNNRDALINVRTEAFAGSDLVAQLPIAAEVDVYAVSDTVDPDGYYWYYIETELDGAPIAGWLREDVVDELTPCQP
ncbi:MAG: hypothetical protein RLP44_19250 [Aggregatilineales bacterium]